MKINRNLTSTSEPKRKRPEHTSGEISHQLEPTGQTETPACPTGYSGITGSTVDKAVDPQFAVPPYPPFSPEDLTCPVELAMYYVTGAGLREFTIWLRGLPHLHPELTVEEVKEGVTEGAPLHAVYLWGFGSDDNPNG